MKKIPVPFANKLKTVTRSSSSQGMFWAKPRNKFLWIALFTFEPALFSIIVYSFKSFFPVLRGQERNVVV